jgi:peptidyl-prolyl cis-trans isomerase C
MKRVPSPGRAVSLAAGLLVMTVSFTPVYAETVMTVNGVDIDSAVIDLYIQSRTQKPADQATAAERESIVSELADIYLLTSQPRVQELMNDPQIKAQQEIQTRGLMAQVVATDFMQQNAATDEEILAEYTTQIKLAPAEQFKARHILVETQAAAVGLVAQLDDGADFSQLAIDNSTGPSGPSGGDLGWFSPNQMVAEFSGAVAQLEDGQYTAEPVQTQFGWHVILREESRASEPPTLDSVRDVIKQRVEQQKLQEYLFRLRELDE